MLIDRIADHYELNGWPLGMQEAERRRVVRLWGFAGSEWKK